MMGGGHSEWGIGFTNGYVCAVAEILRTHDDEVIAKDVLRGLKDTFKELEERDCASEDLQVIEKIAKELEKEQS